MGLFQSKESEPPAATESTETISDKGTLPAKSVGGVFMAIVGGAIILWLGLQFYNWLRNRQGLQPLTIFGGKASTSGDKAPVAIDGKTKTTIEAADAPAGSGLEYGVQFWMYIADWNYRFGQNKQVLKRITPDNSSTTNPQIFLDPNTNTLHCKVSIYSSQSAGSTSSTGDSFTCSVENVPLQTWFSVSTTVFQRNLDIYINGRLVKSCVLPGVPRPAVGDIILNDDGGFSGSICNVNYYNTALTPDDAKAFHSKGTTCQGTSAGETSVRDSLLANLFGYTFRFSTFNRSGKELSSYTF
jgi:hypothetical protein